jgi:hypothetical protein
VPLKVRDVASALTTKGFKEAPNRDHRYFFLHLSGKKTHINTKISHGETEIHDQNCSLMAKQMKLTSPQFRDFVDCDIELDKYVKILTDAGHLKKPQ